jgi:hypothetical protein
MTDHMTTPPDPPAASANEENSATQAPWLPLVIIVLAQLQMGINLNALPVSLGPIADDLDAPATAVGTALVLYSLFVAAFVMVGAKIGKLLGERLVFQVGVAGHGVAMLLMAISTDVDTMNTAQAIAGIAAAALVPTLVVLIAANYHGRQQETALGVLASVPAIASGLTFVVAGFIATALNWRYTFGLIVFLAIAVLILSARLKPVQRQRGVRVDLVGVVISAAAIALIRRWSSLLRSLFKAGRPVDPAPPRFNLLLSLFDGSLHSAGPSPSIRTQRRFTPTHVFDRNARFEPGLIKPVHTPPSPSPSRWAPRIRKSTAVIVELLSTSHECHSSNVRAAAAPPNKDTLSGIRRPSEPIATINAPTIADSGTTRLDSAMAFPAAGASVKFLALATMRTAPTPSDPAVPNFDRW